MAANPRRVTAKVEVTAPATWTEPAIQSLKDQLAPVITPIDSNESVLVLAADFDDINDYVGIGKSGPSTHAELESVVELAVRTALGEAGLPIGDQFHLKVSEVTEH
jgi:hypothetical protein